MRHRERAIWALSIAVACAILLGPAIWNHYPILQWDTGGYLARWFEGYLVPSRSTVYGLLVAAGIPFDFWPVIVLQAAVTIWMVALVLRVHDEAPQAGALAGAIVVLSVATTLPWIASILLTDIFAGLSVLALHLLLFEDEKLSKRERIALIGLIGFSASTHSATFAVLMGLLVVAALAYLVRRAWLPLAGILRGAAALALGAAMLLTANFILSGRAEWTPGGYGIVFGRMLQDGIVKRYLDDNCPDPRLRLCAHRDAIPQNADAFLWGDSVFDELGRFTGLGEEMRTIVLESLVQYPMLQIRAAIVDTAKQIVSVRSGEGVRKDLWHTYGIMERFTPSVLPAMRAARQQHGGIKFKKINRVHVPVALASMALLPVLVWIGWRRRQYSGVSNLAATVGLAILANAAVCGALSDPHDRYGARIVWIATFTVLIAALRFLRERKFEETAAPAPARGIV
jgi:hypothetical protein